ncbi:MAG TPA: hypothetical protein ENI51_02920 [Candidatus Atribacteria bacterium]|nr:hypothetical protein [Candidatus Atribacteria bacterium]
MLFKRHIKKVASIFKHLLYLQKIKRHRKKYKNIIFNSPKILILMSGGIGNAIEATPLVQAIRIFWPQAYIAIYPPPGDLFEDWCVVDRIIKNTNELREKDYDHVFVCSGRLPKDFCNKARNIHFVRCILWKWFLKPEREYYLDMLRRLGYKGFTPPLYVSISKPKISISPASLRISIVPGGKVERKWMNKRWPYYSSLVEKLLENYPNSQVCIVGSRGDYLSKPLPVDSRIIDLRGKLSLRETAWVFKNSNLVIGNDCGPLHIADAVQTISLVIFGPTCELKNSPAHKAVPLYLNFSCRPCQYNLLIESCKYPRCIQEISVEFVMEKVNLLKDLI